MKHGGKRPGAGRKKGFSGIEAEKAREYIAKRLAKALDPILDALIERAKAGDIRAAHELLDRAYGRPPESIALTGNANPVVFQVPRAIAEKHGLVKFLGD
jgi:hypothetical protein